MGPTQVNFALAYYNHNSKGENGIAAHMLRKTQRELIIPTEPVLVLSKNAHWSHPLI